jgi:hypothetical protein
MFKDAVVVTRRMAIRYLWIDALCIVQDDYEDWITQAPLKGTVYQNSRLTIAAHSAYDSTIGLFASRVPPECINAPHSDYDGLISDN